MELHVRESVEQYRRFHSGVRSYLYLISYVTETKHSASWFASLYLGFLLYIWT